MKGAVRNLIKMKKEMAENQWMFV